MGEENNEQEQTITQQNSSAGKGLRITNIILLAISSIIECIAMYSYIPAAISIAEKDAGGIIATIFTMLPMFVLMTGILIIMVIATKVIKKILKRKLLAYQKPVLKIDSICSILPTLYLVINIACFLLLYIL